MNVTKKVTEVLVGLTGEDTIKESNYLQEDLGLDSLAMVTLLMEIEEAFDVTLAEADMNPFDMTTVQDVIDMIGKYCGDEHE